MTGSRVDVAELPCTRCGKVLPLLDVATCTCGTWLTPFAASEVLSAEERRIHRGSHAPYTCTPCPICKQQMFLRGAVPGLFQGCSCHGYWIDAEAADSTGLARGIDLEALERRRGDPAATEATIAALCAQQMRTDLEQLDDDLRRSDAAQLRAREELEQARAEAAALKAELRSRNEAVNEAVNDAMKESLADATAHEQQVATLERQLGDSSRKLRDALTQTEAQASQLHALEGRVKELSDVNDALRAQVTLIGERTVQLEADRDRFAQDMARETANRTRGDEEATRLRAQLEQRDHDLRRSEDELARLRRDLDQLGAKLAAMSDELQVRGTTVTEHERQVAKLNGQLDTAERKLLEALREIDAKEAELRTLDARAKELFEANNALRSEIAQASKQREQLDAARASEARENARLQQNLNGVTSTLAEYQQSVQRLENQGKALEVERDQFRQVIEAQQERILTVDEARKRVELMFHDLQLRHHQLDVGHELAKGENAKLAQENAMMRAELGRLQLEIQHLLRDRVVDRSLHDALAANEDLRKELAQAQQTIIGLTADRETFERLRMVMDAHAGEAPPPADGRAPPPADRNPAAT